jgi:hypothetical protein
MNNRERGFTFKAPLNLPGWIIFTLAVVMLIEFCVPSLYAESVSACEGALVKSTYNRLSSDHLDWRLAQYVSENTYDEIKHDAGASAVIYGVPVGGNYSDFKKSIENRVNSLRTSLSHDQALNIMWTGLDPNSVTTYSACIQSLVMSTSGLHMAVKSATARDIALTLRWVPRGSDPGTISVSWTGIRTDIDGKQLPPNVTQGDTTIIVARPQVRRQLAVNANGVSDVVTIEPIPPPPPTVMPFAFALTAAGFTNKCSGRRQIPGTACGSEGVSIYEGATGPLTHASTINGKAGVPLSFRWDQCWVCQGQGIKGYPQNLGTISFGEGTTATIPEIAGVATVTYPLPGSYTVTVRVTATCIDVNKPDNPCGGQASVQINIAP